MVAPAWFAPKNRRKTARLGGNNRLRGTESRFALAVGPVSWLFKDVAAVDSLRSRAALSPTNRTIGR